MLTTTVAGRTWHFDHSIGHFVGPQGYTYPTPIAMTPTGTMYVADIGLAEYSGAGGLGSKIYKHRIEDEFLGEMGAGDLRWPEGLALAARRFRLVRRRLPPPDLRLRRRRLADRRVG